MCCLYADFAEVGCKDFSAKNDDDVTMRISAKSAHDIVHLTCARHS
jgi:hypothetical protein